MEFYKYIFSALVLRACSATDVSKTNKGLRKKADDIAHKDMMLYAHAEFDFEVIQPHTIRMQRTNSIAMSLGKLEFNSECSSNRPESENRSTQAFKLYFSLPKNLS